MKQRYDLLAISLLLFTAVFAVWISLMPINLDGLWRWQTLIGGFVTGSGVLVASWNVTRQMRLAARGREQDKLERELPGLRAAAFLLGRISLAIGKAPNGAKILKELKDCGFDRTKHVDFVQQVIDALPSTFDFTRRELALQLYKLRVFALRVIQKEHALSDARRALSDAEAPFTIRGQEKLTESDVSEMADKVAEQEATLATMIGDLVKAVHDFEAYREQLLERGKADADKYELLRREHEKALGLPY